MRKGAVTVALLLSLTGCMGEASALPEELAVYDFSVKVQVNPTQPIAGRTLFVNLDIISRSNTYVSTDIVLHIVRADGSLVTERVFDEIAFDPEEIWNLTQGHIPGSDDTGALHIEVIVRKHDTGKELWRSSEPVSFVVN